MPVADTRLRIVDCLPVEPALFIFVRVPDLRILSAGESEDMEWQVDGMAASKIRVDRVDPAHTSAFCMVNRVPDVIAAPPGIRLLLERGMLRPRFRWNERGSFPAACLMLTYRAPVSVVASGLKVLQLFYAPFTDSGVEPEQYAMAEVGDMAVENQPALGTDELRHADAEIELLNQKSFMLL